MSPTFNQYAHVSHRRFNPLTGEFVLVSPHRTARPWQGATETVTHEKRGAFDPACYLCPGSTRANGNKNPVYANTYVFENDFSALTSVPADRALLWQSQVEASPFFINEPAVGECRVICFSPRHDLTLADMSPDEILAVITLWQTEYIELSKRYRWVQIFENKGTIMGCSNPHPHGQIWASQFMPTDAEREDSHQQAYFKIEGEPLLYQYMQAELKLQERIVCQNADWLVVVPYWATWPFETLLLPQFKIENFSNLTAAQQHSLAAILKEILRRYDRLFNCSFPYTMGWHGHTESYWQLHAHFYPPLLRSQDVKKFMVGYEMLAEAQRDLSAEAAAATLREL